MVSIRAANISVGEVGEMGDVDSNTVLPQKVIFWRLRIFESGTAPNQRIEVGYNGVFSYMRTTEDITKVLEKVLDGNFPAETDWKTPKEYGSTPPKTPLSIFNNKEKCYMVFILDKKNWQFAEKELPFQVENGKEEFYLGAKCAWKAGTKYYFRRRPSALVNCTVAYFIANGDEDSEFSAGDFSTSFNIYLNLTFPVTIGSNVVTRLLPIMVDPDVGYPGGNGEP
jgi:hypothetical protein